MISAVRIAEFDLLTGVGKFRAWGQFPCDRERLIRGGKQADVLNQPDLIQGHFSSHGYGEESEKSFATFIMVHGFPIVYIYRVADGFLCDIGRILRSLFS
jgi:hypothetical protein